MSALGKVQTSPKGAKSAPLRCKVDTQLRQGPRTQAERLCCDGKGFRGLGGLQAVFAVEPHLGRLRRCEGQVAELPQGAPTGSDQGCESQAPRGRRGQLRARSLTSDIHDKKNAVSEGATVPARAGVHLQVADLHQAALLAHDPTCQASTQRAPRGLRGLRGLLKAQLVLVAQPPAAEELHVDPRRRWSSPSGRFRDLALLLDDAPQPCSRSVFTLRSCSMYFLMGIQPSSMLTLGLKT